MEKDSSIDLRILHTKYRYGPIHNMHRQTMFFRTNHKSIALHSPQREEYKLLQS